MVSQTVYSVVIFSHRVLDSDCINFKTFAFLAVYDPSEQHYTTKTSKVQFFFNWLSTKLNNMSLIKCVRCGWGWEQWRRNTPSKQSFGGQAIDHKQCLPPKPLSPQSVPAPLGGSHGGGGWGKLAALAIAKGGGGGVHKGAMTPLFIRE